MDPQNPQGNNPPPPPPPGNRPPPPPPRTPGQPDRPSQPQVPQYGQPPVPPQPAQPDYRAPGGYTTGSASQPDQPAQGYGYGQAPQGGYQGYPPPPQQGDGRQYNVNAPKKGAPPWLWGVIGALVVALIGGGVLLFFLLSPKPNTPAGSTTPQPTAAAGNPTTVPGQPTTAPGLPTTSIRQPTTVAQPTRSLPTTQVPTPGQGGLPGAAPDQVVTIFFDRIRARDFAGALELAEPESSTTITPDSLRSSWESVEQQNGGKLQSIEITDMTETGDTAQVALTEHFEGGGTFNQIALLRNNGNSWVITGFNAADSDPAPTEVFPIPTEEVTEEGTEVVPYIFLVGENLLTFSEPLEPGWTVGIAYFGFENRSGQLRPSQLLENAQVSVETQEGKVYPGTLFYRTPDMYGGGKVLEDMVLGPSYIFQDSAQLLDPDPGIPPGLPIASTSVIHPVYGSAVTVSWFVGFRFAEASHPTRIVLKSGQTMISGDLPAPVPVGAGDPYEMAQAAQRFAPAYDEAKSLSDLATRLMQINPKLQLAFESCTVADDPKGRFRYYRIPYTATNSNSLDNEELAVPYGIWKENGNYIQAMARNPLIKVGPGQTANSELQVYADANPQRFVLLLDAGVEMYTLGCPSTTAETYASPPTAIVAEAFPSNTSWPTDTPKPTPH